MMKSIVEKSLILVLLLISNGLTAQEQDTLHFIIYGDFKKTEKFQLRNWNKYICEFNSDSSIV